MITTTTIQAQCHAVLEIILANEREVKLWRANGSDSGHRPQYLEAIASGIVNGHLVRVRATRASGGIAQHISYTFMVDDKRCSKADLAARLA